MEIDNIYEEYKIYEIPKILFYDIKTGETLFNYTLDDYLKDNSEEDSVFSKTYNLVGSNQNENLIKIDKINNEYSGSRESLFLDKELMKDLDKNVSNENLSFQQLQQNSNQNITRDYEKLHEDIYIKKSYFVKINSLSGFVKVLRRPNIKSLDNLKNRYILNIIPFTNNEINIFTKIFRNKKKFINNPHTIYYINGDVYKGEVNKKLEKNGYGSFYYTNGDKLAVEWKKNIPEGFGKYIYFDGSRFEGFWKNNSNNRIIHSSINYDSCTEPFSSYSDRGANYSILNGKKEGYGVYTWPNGSSYKGMWYNDLYHGYGILDYRDNNGYSFIYEGNWHNGCYILDIKNTY